MQADPDAIGLISRYFVTKMSDKSLNKVCDRKEVLSKMSVSPFRLGSQMMIVDILKKIKARKGFSLRISLISPCERFLPKLFC